MSRIGPGGPCPEWAVLVPREVDVGAWCLCVCVRVCKRVCGVERGVSGPRLLLSLSPPQQHVAEVRWEGRAGPGGVGGYGD